MPGELFLSETKLRDFRTPGRIRKRRIVRSNARGLRGATSESFDLVEGIRSDLRSLPRRAGTAPFFSFSAIIVQHDDGATTSAELIAEMLEEEYGTPNVRRMSPALGSVDRPDIAQLIGERPLIRGATQAGALERTRYWSALAPLGAVAVVATVVARTMPPQVSLSDILTLSGSSITALVAAAATVVAGIVIRKLDIRSRSEKLRRLTELLAPNEELLQREKLVDALAAEVARYPFPRYVVIDEFEKLDPLTRDVISAYLRGMADRTGPDRKGAEAWISIESPDGQPASRGLAGAWERLSAEHVRNVEYFNSYEQKFLTKEERLELAESIGRPDRAHFKQVKLISSESDADVQEHEQALRRYNEAHPRRPVFSELDLLYFLSLAFREHGTPLPNSFLTKIIAHGAPQSKSAWDVKNLLYDFFGTTVLPGVQLEARLEDIRTRLGGMMTKQVGGRESTYEVLPAAAAALEDIYQELNLRPPGLGHLFWALYIEKNLLGEPYQAVWVRKLAYHLSRAEPEHIASPENYRGAVNDYLTALLRCADATLRVCLFAQTIPLLKRAAALVVSEKFPAQNRAKKSVLSALWEAYTVLGDDELLTLAIGVRHASVRDAKREVEISPLVELFTATIPLSATQRDLLESLLGQEYAQARSDERAAADYGTARAAWLALTVAPSALNLTGSKLQRAVLASEEVTDIFNRTSARILKSIDKRVSLLDLATLSIAYWGEVFRLRENLVFFEAYRAATLANDVVGETTGLEANVPEPAFLMGDLVEHTAAARFSRVVAAATESVLIAQELYRSGRETPRRKRQGFVLDALCEEMCAVALAGILQAWKFAQPHGIGDRVSLDSVQGVVQAASQLLKITLPPLHDLESLASNEMQTEVDKLLRVSGMVWQQFGATTWATMLQIRRAQYRAFCLGEEVVDEEKMIPVSTHEILLQSGSLAVLGQLALADAMRLHSGEISAHHSRTAARTAIRSDPPLDSQLCRDLCFLAIESSHAYENWDKNFFLSPLLETVDGQPYLEQFLRGLGGGQITGRMLQMLNVSSGDSPVAEAVRASMRKVAAEYSSPSARSEIDDVLLLLDLEKIKNEPVVSDVWDEWSKRRDSWVYLVFLEYALGDHQRRPDALAATVEVLRSGSLDEDITAPYHLTIRLATEVLRSQGLAEQVDSRWLARSLRARFNRWKSRQTTEQNLAVLRLLKLLDPEEWSKEDENETLHWQMTKMRRDHMARFTQLADDVRMFIILFDTVDMLADYGLPLDATVEEYYRKLNRDGQARAAALRALSANPAVEVRPLILGAQSWISTDFLSLGIHLFTPPANDLHEFHDLRVLFNKLAGEALPKIFDLAVHTPSIPDPIRELVKEFSDRFDEIQLPSETAVVAA